MEDKMFWGVIIHPDKRYEQVVEEPFHVSKACLEPSSASGAPFKGTTTLYVESDNEEFILTHLGEKASITDNLDLNFQAGEKICFKTTGQGTVHLSGFLHQDEPGMGGYDSDDELEMEEAEEESEEEEVPALVNLGGKKRKMENGQESSPKKSKQTPLDNLLATKKAKGDLKEDKNAAIKNAKEASKKLLSGELKGPKLADDDEDDDDDDDDDFEDMDDEEEEDSDDEEMDDDDEESDDDEEADEKPAMKGKENDKSAEKTPSKKQDGKKDSPKKQQQQQKKQENGKEKTPAKTPNDKKKQQQPEKTPKKDNKTPKKDGQQQADKTPGKKDNAAKPTPKKTPKRTMKGGLVVEELKEGSGPEAKRGKMVGMFYDGRLANGNKRFDANLKGEPFKFRLGAGEVIKGWDIGVEGMKVGGKRKLTVPAKMAYGAAGAAPDIPPNATLTFEVECKFVK